MNFSEDIAVYYLSPFKILHAHRNYGQGYPYCTHFHTVSLWEFELLVTSDRPNSLQDVSLSIKYHFGVIITKTMLIGSSLVLSEAKQGIDEIVKNSFSIKLRERLLSAMIETKR